VIVECDRCRAKYHYDESRFGGKPSKKLRCSKCEAIFEVFNAHPDEAEHATPPPIAAGETMTRRSSDATRGADAPRDPTPVPERKRDPGALKLPLDTKLSLAVIAGPDAGRMFSIDKPRIVMGREDVDLALDDAEISRHHAALEVRGEEVLLVDLGSTNGTFVGDQPISRVPIENQGEFTIGGSTLMLIITSA
jgi:predicted Zn finger-like uncharacterized protein